VHELNAAVWVGVVHEVELEKLCALQQDDQAGMLNDVHSSVQHFHTKKIYQTYQDGALLRAARRDVEIVVHTRRSLRVALRDRVDLRFTERISCWPTSLYKTQKKLTKS
jgi:hypothetical protein